MANEASQQHIIPMLAYNDAASAIDFLCNAYGFEETFKMQGDDGKVAHAELALGAGQIMLATTWKGAGMASPIGLAGVHTQLHCPVDDVDAHYSHAVAAGAVVLGEPADQFYGLRTYRTIDPEGHRWIFSSPVRKSEAEQ